MVGLIPAKPRNAPPQPILGALSHAAVAAVPRTLPPPAPSERTGNQRTHVTFYD